LRKGKKSCRSNDLKHGCPYLNEVSRGIHEKEMSSVMPKTQKEKASRQQKRTQRRKGASREGGRAVSVEINLSCQIGGKGVFLSKKGTPERFESVATLKGGRRATGKINSEKRKGRPKWRVSAPSPLQLTGSLNRGNPVRQNSH